VANDIAAELVGHAHGHEGGMGQGGVDVAGVGRGHNAVDDNITVQGVGVVQTIGTHSGNGGHGGALAVLGLQLVANLDDAGDSHLAVDVQVVVLGQHDVVAILGLEGDELGVDGREAVSKHEDIAVLLLRIDEHLVADLDLVHADDGAVAELHGGMGGEAHGGGGGDGGVGA